MIVALYIAAAAIMAAGSLYFAWRNRDFRKFLAGAFFVSSGAARRAAMRSACCEIRPGENVTLQIPQP